MTDGHDEVVQALNDCEEVFRRGVYSYHAGSDLEIEDAAITLLKGLLESSFTKHLNPENPADKRDWEKDKEHVFPAAFYAGALAGLYAHGATEEPLRTVTRDRARDALDHVVPHCRGPEPSDASGEDHRVRWRYCPPRL